MEPRKYVGLACGFVGWGGFCRPAAGLFEALTFFGQANVWFEPVPDLRFNFTMLRPLHASRSFERFGAFDATGNFGLPHILQLSRLSRQ